MTQSLVLTSGLDHILEPLDVAESPSGREMEEFWVCVRGQWEDLQARAQTRRACEAADETLHELNDLWSGVETYMRDQGLDPDDLAAKAAEKASEWANSNFATRAYPFHDDQFDDDQ